MTLVKNVYTLTDKLPKHEVFGICTQVQRATISIPSNIAEGHERNNIKEYIQFLGIAKGSAAELKTQLLIIEDVYNISIVEMNELILEIRRMLHALVKILKTKV